MHQAYDDILVVFFFSIFYEVACNPYYFCCFHCINVDEHFIVDKVVDNVITIECYAREKTCVRQRVVAYFK
jgi:hypothetical protein